MSLFCSASGNRDPRHYEDPDAFLVKRNPVDHLSFGYGVHACAGQGLARLEAFAVLDALVTRGCGGSASGQPERKINNSSLGLDKLPVLEVVPACAALPDLKGPLRPRLTHTESRRTLGPVFPAPAGRGRNSSGLCSAKR